MDKFSTMLFRYVERFGENFPTFDFPYASEAEIMATIEKCLETGKRYESKTDPEANT